MSHPTENRGQPLVLVADDDAATRLIATEVLRQAGFDVVEASDGKEALRRYDESAPDIILLDVEMPYFDGFSVCEMIRDKETTRRTPICIVTGLDDEKSIDRAYDVGATDFISKPIGWAVLAHRVRYMLRASDALNETRSLVLALPDRVFILDENGRTLKSAQETNTNSKTILDAAAGRSFEELFSDEDSAQVQECIRMALDGGEWHIHEHSLADDEVHLETRFVARDRNSVLAIVRDVTERKKAELQIYDLAFYDRLTGLPNRELYAKQLAIDIDHARRHQEIFSILFVDLDRFKRINDTLGHSMGDALLEAVATRLRQCTRSADHVARAKNLACESTELARFGGDEFVLTLRDIGSTDAAASVASRIITAISEPLTFEGHQFVVTPSIGIAMFPQDGQSSDDLLMNADAAMYKAKAAGRNNYRFYSGSMKVRSLQRLELENELRRAIDDEHFELYYQPKVDASSTEIVGAEALLRWNHSELGWISPADFIPIAEETGLILPLGRWVLQAACRQLGAWRHSELSEIRVSVNVSSQQMHSGDLVAVVKDAVSGVGIRAQLLELEITESLLMRDVEETIEALTRLKKLGVGLSVDDFGTGYSSLSYLKRFPIDILKIDRSFVQDLHRDSDDAAICAAILAMAKKLDLEVIAEGVEIEEQLAFLRHHGCDQIQGFLFSKPLAADEFEALVLSHWNTRESAAS